MTKSEIQTQAMLNTSHPDYREIADKFFYKFEYLEKVHSDNLKFANCRERQPDASNPPKKQMEEEIARENERYQKEKTRLENKFLEMAKLKNLPEVLDTYSGWCHRNMEIESMIERGYTVEAVFNLTDELNRGKQAKLYKFNKPEND